METKHTPGPWEVIDGRIFSSSYMTKGAPIATVHARTMAGMQKANGDLLSASPDMLLALQEVLKTPGLQSGLQAMCAAAVAKALGKSIDEVLASI